MAKWVLKRNKAYTEKIAEAFGISEITANVLANRGLGTYEEIEMFINCGKKDMHDAMQMQDMEKGLEIIKKALLENKKIVVYGDYDVDGVMSTVILYKTLKSLKADVKYHVPHRQKEGYGMNVETVKDLAEEGAEVILACDNGIVAHEEIAEAKKRGIVVVILDHHETKTEEDAEGVKRDVLPCADAVIDNKRMDCRYPFKKLCAAGMCYKFSQLLFKKMGINFKYDDEFLTFAAIATVCDIVDLKDENRIIAKNGLKMAENTENIGLKALKNIKNIQGALTAYQAGFIIGPCVNATGRLQSAELSVKLFVTEDEEEAKITAEELARLNDERKLMTSKAYEEALKTIEQSGIINDRVLVVYCPAVHESIAGIAAARIKEKYYKPVIMITKGEQGAKGSARSIEGYNIYEELAKCRELFEKFGGHPMAAGLSLKEENIDILRKRLNENCVLTKEDLTPVIKVDAIVDFQNINIDCAKELENIEPYGAQNPMPIFASTNVVCERVPWSDAENNRIKFLFKDKNGVRLEGISFRGYNDFARIISKQYDEETCGKILKGQNIEVKLDILYNIEVNRYNGRESVQLKIEDIRRGD